jgi:hypothetical protein
MRLNPYVGFLAVLFILMTCASLVAMVSQKEGLTTLFTFVPRWEGRRCGPEPNWEGPRDYPENSNPPWTFVSYEGFLSAEEKDVSRMSEAGGTGQDLRSGGAIPGDPLLTSPPGKPAPVDSVNRDSFLLLGDEFKPMPLSSGISCVNSRSCFASDFNRLQEKTGNYRQITNNFKHAYPDSCSAPFQELAMSFYESKGLKVDAPKNCI